MKLLSVLVVSLMLVSCGRADKIVANFTGYSTNCVEGVKYIQFSTGATVMYNQDNTVKRFE